MFLTLVLALRERVNAGNDIDAAAFDATAIVLEMLGCCGVSPRRPCCLDGLCRVVASLVASLAAPAKAIVLDAAWCCRS